MTMISFCDLVIKLFLIILFICFHDIYIHPLIHIWNNIVFTRREILLFKGFLNWISNIWSPVIKIGFRKQVKVVRKSYDISNMTSWYWPFRLVSLNENIRMIGWRCRTHETSPKYFIIFVPVSSDDIFLMNIRICLKQ